MAFKVLRFKTREAWLECRAIGGSDVAAIFNQSPWQSPIDLFLKLVTDVRDKEKESPVLDRGNRLEPLIRKGFAEDYRDVYKVTSPPGGNWIFYRPEKPWLTASLDGKLKRLSDGAFGVLEIKTVDVKDGEEKEFWEGDSLPQQYYFQVQAYALVTGARFVVLRARIRYLKYDGEKYSVEKVVLRDYYIDEDEKKKELEFLDRKVEEFWNENVLKGKFPEVKIID